MRFRHVFRRVVTVAPEDLSAPVASRCRMAFVLSTRVHSAIEHR